METTDQPPIIPTHGKPAVEKTNPAAEIKRGKSLIQIIEHLPHTFPRVILKKPLYTLAALLIFVLLLLLLFFALQPRRTGQTPLPTPPPVPPSPTPLPQDISESGSTEEFKKLEEKLLNIQDEINTLDLLESRLTLPVIELNIGL